MEPAEFSRYKKSGPEKIIEDKLKDFLKARDWLVIKTHGNEFQMGLPDLWCAHYTLNVRWIEVKNPEKYSFTPAQLEVFPAMQSKGVGIWILTHADEYEYQKLFQPPNWHKFLGKTSMKRIG